MSVRVRERRDPVPDPVFPQISQGVHERLGKKAKLLPGVPRPHRP
jgi:hypothetical protein